MNKLIIAFFIGFIFSNSLFAENVDERSVSVSGDVTAAAESYDGKVYLVTKSNELIELNTDGTQTRKVLEVPGKKSSSYFSDIAIKGNNIFLCSYDSQAVYLFNKNKPDKFKAIPVVDVKNPIKPMTLSVDGGNVFLQDADLRTYKITASGKYSEMPQFTEVVSDKGSGIIIPPAEFKDNDIVYEGKVFSETDNKIIWQAPKPESPYKLLGVSFIGIDDLGRKIFLTKSSAGELAERYILYATIDGEVDAIRVIPGPSSMHVLRYCKLSESGILMLILADPNNKDGVIIKHININSRVLSAG